MSTLLAGQAARRRTVLDSGQFPPNPEIHDGQQRSEAVAVIHTGSRLALYRLIPPLRVNG